MKPGEKASLLRSWRRGAVDLPRTAEKPVGDVLKKILPKLGLDQQVRQNELVTAWPEIVGKVVAKHARPVSLRDGILTVGVDNSMWLSELSRYQKPLLLRKVRDHLGKTAVKDVLFRVEG